MNIKMNVSMSGIDFSLSPGDVTDRFSDDEVKRLIASGQADPVVEERTVKAVKPKASEKRG